MGAGLDIRVSSTEPNSTSGRKDVAVIIITIVINTFFPGILISSQNRFGHFFFFHFEHRGF